MSNCQKVALLPCKKGGVVIGSVRKPDARPSTTDEGAKSVGDRAFSTLYFEHLSSACTDDMTVPFLVDWAFGWDHTCQHGVCDASSQELQFCTNRDDLEPNGKVGSVSSRVDRFGQFSTWCSMLAIREDRLTVERLSCHIDGWSPLVHTWKFNVVLQPLLTSHNKSLAVVHLILRAYPVVFVFPVQGKRTAPRKEKSNPLHQAKPSG